MPLRFAAILVCCIVGCVVCCLASAAVADDARRVEQVNAATSDAYDSLRGEVLALPLGNDFTAAALIDRNHARDQLAAVIQTARQIGGTRWLDEQTVQIRLELPGGDVARLLQTIAEHNTKILPMPLHVLRERLKRDIAKRTFSATGTSTSARVADRLRPDPLQIAWRNVSDKDRVTAIEAARANAIERVLDSLRPIEWNHGQRLGDTLGDPALHNGLRDWLAARPLVSIDFRDDLEVRLTLAVSADTLWPALRDALQHAHPPTPIPNSAWDGLRVQVLARMVPAVGSALVSSPGAAAGGQRVAIPSEAPAWSRQDAAAEGVAASVGGSKLRTARAAEAIALESLRARLYALPLNPSITLGEAAGKDPRIADAISRGLTQARISKVDYDSPAQGAVRVRMGLDLEAVWRELGR